MKTPYTVEVLTAIADEILSSDAQFKPELDANGKPYGNTEQLHQRLGWKIAHRNLLLKFKAKIYED